MVLPLTAEVAHKAVVDFCTLKEGSILRAWVQKFDRDHELRVTKQYFGICMREWGYPHSASELFEALDDNESGELTLDELSKPMDDLWRLFRAYSARTFFGGVEDYARRVGKSASLEEFSEQIRLYGWRQGQEDELFLALSADRRVITLQDMRWLDIECRRHRRKVKAKAATVANARTVKPLISTKNKELLNEFKHFVKMRFGQGSLLRAWRTSLAVNDALVLQKTQFLKACAEMNWKTEVKGIWDVMDKDGSGSVTLEEFDFKSAEILARFYLFMKENFGNSAAAFAAIDKDKLLSLREPEFASSLQNLGWKHPTKMLFQGFDKDNRRRITKDNLHFLDRWKPREFLWADPSQDAFTVVKSKLLEKYSSYIKAWRLLLDKDYTYSCNWDEFKDACHELACTGDIAGAWRHVDSKQIGTISLKDIDQESHELILEFRNWADAEFGSAKTAFSIFDDDGSNEVTLLEFKRACRIYGFSGDARHLFRALTTSGGVTLSLEELAFMDGFDLRPFQGDRRRSSMRGSQIAISRKSEKQALPALDTSFDKRKVSAGSAFSDIEDDDPWPEGSLHPAFRSWANARRKQPVKNIDGSIPPLLSQVDLGGYWGTRRPILLLAPIPSLPDGFDSGSPRDSAKAKAHGTIEKSVVKVDGLPKIEELLHRSRATDYLGFRLTNRTERWVF